MLWLPVVATVLALPVGNAGAQTPPDDCAASTDTTCSLTVDGPAVSATHRAHDEVDWFELTLEAEVGYSVAFSRDRRLHGIYDSSGTLVPDTDLASWHGEPKSYGTLEVVLPDGRVPYRVQMTFVVPTSGTYYLAAGLPDHWKWDREEKEHQIEYVQEFPTYWLKVISLPDDCYQSTSTACTAAAGAAVVRHWDYPGDIDWFRISLSAGTAYRITVETRTGDAERNSGNQRWLPLLYGVRDADGTHIPGTRDGVDHREDARYWESPVWADFTPSTSGTYYVSAAIYKAWSRTGDNDLAFAVTVVELGADGQPTSTPAIPWSGAESAGQSGQSAGQSQSGEGAPERDGRHDEEGSEGEAGNAEDEEAGNAEDEEAGNAEDEEAGGAVAGTATLVVANGWSPADVGTAAVLTARTEAAAVVFTGAGALPSAVEQLLRDELPAEVVIVGGESVVSDAVSDRVRAVSPGSGVARVTGIDRAGTAARAARRVLGDPSAAGGVAFVVVNGWSPPDIGAAASLAAGSEQAAVLYTRSGSLPPATAAVLRDYRAESVFVLGGVDAVSAAVADEIAEAAGVAVPTRVTGTDRVGTAVQVARRVLHGAVAASEEVTLVVANGWSSPDVGVAAAFAAATDNAAVLYTGSGALPAATQALIRAYRPGRVFIVGGASAVSATVRAAIVDAAPTAAVRRIAGDNRIDTAAQAARRVLAD
ncbi:cell wall-binding repeat-containing protein [Candidatus Poriferisodalis sp.]|uniref:cell wall-binding repeat-containing protein n=1 Tax=Candidatus Poriferisodalis sp. TaxID=3101277 RepID=UPI003B014777